HRLVGVRNRHRHVEHRREILPHVETALLAADEHRNVTRSFRTDHRGNVSWIACRRSGGGQRGGDRGRGRRGDVGPCCRRRRWRRWSIGRRRCIGSGSTAGVRRRLLLGCGGRGLRPGFIGSDLLAVVPFLGAAQREIGFGLLFGRGVSLLGRGGGLLNR